MILEALATFGIINHKLLKIEKLILLCISIQHNFTVVFIYQYRVLYFVDAVKGKKSDTRTNAT